MKVSDPIIFGHCVKVFFKALWERHGELFDRIGINPNNGLGDLEAHLRKLDEKHWVEIEADVQMVLSDQPDLAIVDSDTGITNLHVPSDNIIDATMPAMIRNSVRCGARWQAA